MKTLETKRRNVRSRHDSVPSVWYLLMRTFLLALCFLKICWCGVCVRVVCVYVWRVCTCGVCVRVACVYVWRVCVRVARVCVSGLRGCVVKKKDFPPPPPPPPPTHTHPLASQLFTHVLVIDFEATCWQEKRSTQEISKHTIPLHCL